MPAAVVPAAVVPAAVVPAAVVPAAVVPAAVVPAAVVPAAVVPAAVVPAAVVPAAVVAAAVVATVTGQRTPVEHRWVLVVGPLQSLEVSVQVLLIFFSREQKYNERNLEHKSVDVTHLVLVLWPLPQVTSQVLQLEKLL